MLVDEEAVANAITNVGPSVCSIGVLQVIQEGWFNAVPLHGMGSGIVFDNKGHVLTNHHIVQAAEELEVLSHTGNRLKAEVLGLDPTSDVAVIEVAEADELRPAELGDSEKLHVGQVVIAIGNSFGFFLKGPTATVGVVSARKRADQH